MMRSSLMYMRLSTDTPRSSGNCCRHFSKNCAIESPFLHCTVVSNIQCMLHRRMIYDASVPALTVTTLRCPEPSQYEYVISISSFFISSCFCNHSRLNSSRILRSASSRSRSGRKCVSTVGFLPSFAFLAGRSPAVLDHRQPDLLRVQVLHEAHPHQHRQCCLLKCDPRRSF